MLRANTGSIEIPLLAKNDLMINISAEKYQ